MNSTPGEYFVTICTYERKCLFGNVVNQEMVLSKEGEIAKDEWIKTQTIRPNVNLDEFVIMPNHIQGIIILNEMDDNCGRGTSQRAPTMEKFGNPTHNSIPTIVRLFKSSATKQIKTIHHSNEIAVWQRGYYEHIIRDEIELNNIRAYIINNPIKWFYDDENASRKYQ